MRLICSRDLHPHLAREPGVRRLRCRWSHAERITSTGAQSRADMAPRGLRLGAAMTFQVMNHQGAIPLKNRIAALDGPRQMPCEGGAVGRVRLSREASKMALNVNIERLQRQENVF